MFQRFLDEIANAARREQQNQISLIEGPGASPFWPNFREINELFRHALVSPRLRVELVRYDTGVKEPMRPAMTTVKARIRVAPDGTITGQATGLPPGEHEAEIALVKAEKGTARLDADTLLARVRAIQEEMAQLPVLDERSIDEIIGYNERGHFD